MSIGNTELSYTAEASSRVRSAGAATFLRAEQACRASKQEISRFHFYAVDSSLLMGTRGLPISHGGSSRQGERAGSPPASPLLKHSERQGGSFVLSSLGPSARALSKQPQRHKDKAEAVIPSTGLASHFLPLVAERFTH